MADAWHSERLVFRAVETTDEPFLQIMNQDATSFLNAAPFLPLPQSAAGAKSFREHLEGTLVGVVICLQPAAAAEDGAAAAGGDADSPKPIPIGTTTLMQAPRQAHHRNAQVGINILRKYHGQGYGSEAIRWLLSWGFRHGNLNKIEIGVFGWNTGALRLYERLGFVREACKREHLWCDGEYWDMIELGMLRREWKEKYGGEKMVEGVVQNGI